MQVPIVLNVPEPKSGLDGAVVRQFSDIAKQLMGLVKEQASSKKDLHEMMLEGLEDQREQLLKAMEKLMTMAGRKADTAPSDALVSAVASLKKAVQRLPTSQKAPTVTVSPKVNVTMPKSLTKRFEDFEEAILKGLKKSRSRTFGSNY